MLAYRCVVGYGLSTDPQRAALKNCQRAIDHVISDPLPYFQQLPAFAAAVYDVIIGSNMIAEKHDSKFGWGSAPEWQTVRKGLDWFRRHFAKEYMVLLD